MTTPTDAALEIDLGEDFSARQQTVLETFFGRNQERLKMGFAETAGFLFAAECSPEPLAPSQWLDPVIGEVEFASREEAGSVIGALFALQRWIGERLNDHLSPLPEGCEPAPEPMANFEPGSALSRWSRGFAMGHGWLQQSWDALVPEDDDDGAGLALMTLTFFSSRRVAESYHADMFSDEMSFEKLVETVDEMLPNAFRDYATAGHAARRSKAAVTRLTRAHNQRRH